VGYLRRSTDKQEQSIPDQRREIERFARENGLRVVDWYIDDARSGTNATKRADYNRLLGDIERPNRAFDVILVYDLSRLTRENPFETISQINFIRKCGVRLVSVTEPLPGNDFDCLMLMVQGMKNHQEVKDTSRKTLRGQVSNAKEGWWCGGAPPYGYDLEYVDRAGQPIAQVRYLETGERQLLSANGTPERILRKRERYRKSDGDKARLVLSAPERVGIVRRIFQMYAADGLGYAAIAHRLNQDGIPSPRNGNYSSKAKAGWGRSTIKNILENRVYLGDAVWNERTSAKFHRVSGERAVARSEQSYEKLKRNGPEDHIVKENAHDVIVDREVFNRARTIAKARNERVPQRYPRTGRGAGSRYLLTSLIRCAMCDHNFTGQPQNRGKRRKDGSPVKTFYYMCRGYLDKGRSKCVGVRIPQTAIESYVLRAIEERIREFMDRGGSALVRKLIGEMLVGNDRVRKQAQLLDQRVGAIEQEIDRLLDCITPDTKEEIGQRIRKLKEERGGMEEEARRLSTDPQNEIDVDKVAEEVTARMRKFKEVFAEGTIEEKKEFVALFVERIDMDPRTKVAKLRIKRFPAPSGLDTGNASFRVVAGACSEHQKKPFPPIDIVELDLTDKGTALAHTAA
jgi:DNA invertase Pin-like site-specific DNA recombinase